MRTIAITGAIATAFAVAPAVATAGNIGTQATVQNHKAQVVDVQVAKVQRAQAATSLQRHLVQVAHGKRFSLVVRTQLR
jgi:hypothetical protein